MHDLLSANLQLRCLPEGGGIFKMKFADDQMRRRRTDVYAYAKKIWHGV
jgi:hypothetical protein